MKRAFTMIEVIFVIVVLGILAGVAIPRLFVTRDDANVARLRADIGAIRSGIALKKSEQLMRGDTNAPDLGDGFTNVLGSPISANSKGNSGWKSVPKDGGKAGETTFEYCIGIGSCAVFTYEDDGSITCEGTACSLAE